MDCSSIRSTSPVHQQSANAISSHGSHDSEKLLNVVQNSFQSLSLREAPPLGSAQQKIFSVLLRRKENELNQTGNVDAFKQALEEVLTNMLSRLEGEDPSHAQFIKGLLHDLKNQTLSEVAAKYYPDAQNTASEGSILAILASYLGDQTKISALALKEAESLPQTLLSHLEFKPTNRDALMALMIQQKEEKHANLNCYVIDMSDLPACLQVLKSLKDFPSPLQQLPQRFQFLVRNDVHYTAVDIECTADGLQAAVMDAAGDKRCKLIVEELKALNCRAIYVVGLEDRIQFDTYQCAFFAFDSVCQSAKDSQFFDLMHDLPAVNQDPLVRHLAWKDMPPRYVRNSTSTTFMANYPAKDQIYKGQDTFDTYVNQHVAQRDINGTMRKVHTILEDRILKKQDKLQALITQTPVQDLSRTIHRHGAQAFIRKHQGV